jgi:hypothetical protein
MIELEQLRQRPAILKSLIGLKVAELDALLEDLLPLYHQAYRQRLERDNRQRAIGGGRHLEMPPEQQFLLTLVWLRLYPTQEVLGYLFSVSDTTALRTVNRILPLLERAGRATLKMPDPGRKHRRSLDQVLHEVPELAVIIDSFEQRVQRPKTDKTSESSKTSKTSKTSKPSKTSKTKDAYYSGKKKQHTLKSQVAVNHQDGTFVDIARSVPGPTADIKLLEQSALLERLPAGVGAWGDLAYVGVDALHPEGLGATPRRKPRGQERPPADITYNRAFARERVLVENSIGRLRRYESLNQMDRHHRQNHTQRVIAVAGLANRQIRHRLPGAA